MSHPVFRQPKVRRIRFLLAALVLSLAATAMTCLAVHEARATEASVPIYRLYNTKTGEHLYTSSAHERDVLASGKVWLYEKVGWNAPTSGTPVYRVYNSRIDDHLYTDEHEATTLAAQPEWTMDNGGRPLFYSGGDVELYRLYHYASERHLITRDLNEYNTLPSQGWLQEGVKMYGLDEGEDNEGGRQGYNHSVYQDNVIANGLEDTTNYRAEESYNGLWNLSVPSGSIPSSAKVGDIVVLPPNDDYPVGSAWKIEKMPDTASISSLTPLARTNDNIIASKPTLPEVYKNLDIELGGVGEVGRYKIAETFPIGKDGEGTVTVSYDSSASIDMSGITSSGKMRTLSTGGEIHYGTYAEIPGVFTLTVKKGDISGTIELAIPRFALQVNQLSTRDLENNFPKVVMAITEQVRIEGGFGKGTSGSVKLADIPLNFPAQGVQLSLVISLTYSADGEAHFIYKLQPTQGFIYTEPDSIEPVFDCMSCANLEMDGKASLGLSAGVTAGILDLPDKAIGYDVNVNGTVHCALNVREPRPGMPRTCCDVELFPCINHGIMKDTFVGNLLPDLRFDVLDDNDDNPFKVTGHLERYNEDEVVLVDTCTWKEDQLGDDLESLQGWWIETTRSGEIATHIVGDTLYQYSFVHGKLVEDGGVSIQKNADVRRVSSGPAAIGEGPAVDISYWTHGNGSATEGDVFHHYLFDNNPTELFFYVEDSDGKITSSSSQKVINPPDYILETARLYE